MLLVSDRALLDGFRRGETAALERVFDHYAPSVAKWASGGFVLKSRHGSHRFTGFRSAADLHDVIHEVFRAAFEPRARQSYSGLTAYEGYLFIITRNLVAKRMGHRNLEVFEEASKLERIASEEPTPEETAAREEERNIVRAFLTTLDDDQTRFVALRFTEQRSQAEVGEALGWSRKKVRIQEESIRRNLTRFLKRARGTAELKEALHDAAR